MENNICVTNMILVAEYPDNVGCGNCGKKMERLAELICPRCGYEVIPDDVVEMSKEEVITLSKDYLNRR